jgi:hypothetical protein
MTADKKRRRPAGKVYWTNQPPPPARKLPPMDIMTKEQELSSRAKAASKLADLWGLFITPDMTAKMVRYTNDKIRETLLKKKYSKADLLKKPHVKLVDLVSSSKFLIFWFRYIKYRPKESIMSQNRPFSTAIYK